MRTDSARTARRLLLGVAAVAALAASASCGGSGSTTTTTAAGGGGGSAGASTTAPSSTTSTTEPGPSGAAGCPQGTYELLDPGTGIPFQIASGGTGTVLSVDADDRVELSFDDYVTATGTAAGGSFSIDASGVITARLVESGDGTYSLADVDASGISGQQTITLDGGEPITISGPDFTALAEGLAPFGPGATLECTPGGDIQAAAGPITQTYVRR